MKSWATWYAWLMGGLVACGLATMGHLYYLTNERRAGNWHRVPWFEGIDLAGHKWKPGNAPCRIVRVTSDSCVYCRADEKSYALLIEAARASKCEIVELGPRIGDLAAKPRVDIVQLKYVTRDLGRDLVTPDTIILDRHFSQVWSRRGVLGSEGLRDAVQMIEALSGKHDSL